MVQKQQESFEDISIKYALYAGKIDNILTQLFILGILNRECFIQEYAELRTQNCGDYPSYASNIIYELEWDDELNQSFVSVRYNGVYYKICDDSPIGDQKKSCTLDNFSILIQSRVNNKWEEYCNFAQINGFNQFEHREIVFVQILIGTVLTLICLIVVLILSKWKIKDTPQIT